MVKLIALVDPNIHPGHAKAIFQITMTVELKGVQKKCPRSKFKGGLLTRTVCPRRLSFSQFRVLMSTLNCEKDNLLGQMVLVKRPLSNFERGHFYLYTLYI